MSKRYEEPIDVEAPEGSLEAFWWRGRQYRVRQVLCRWREAGGWWEETSQNGDKPWASGDAREIVRLEAQNGTARSGTYELCRDLRTGVWTLFRVWD